MKKFFNWIASFLYWLHFRSNVALNDEILKAWLAPVAFGHKRLSYKRDRDNFYLKPSLLDAVYWAFPLLRSLCARFSAHLKGTPPPTMWSDYCVEIPSLGALLHLIGNFGSSKTENRSQKRLRNAKWLRNICQKLVLLRYFWELQKSFLFFKDDMKCVMDKIQQIPDALLKVCN